MRKNVGFVLIGVVILLHVLLAMGFMLYFFHVPNGFAHYTKKDHTELSKSTFFYTASPSMDKNLNAYIIRCICITKLGSNSFKT